MRNIKSLSLVGNCKWTFSTKETWNLFLKGKSSFMVVSMEESSHSSFVQWILISRKYISGLLWPRSLYTHLWAVLLGLESRSRYKLPPWCFTCIAVHQCVHHQRNVKHEDPCAALIVGVRWRFHGVFVQGSRVICSILNKSQVTSQTPYKDELVKCGSNDKLSYIPWTIVFVTSWSCFVTKFWIL